MTTRYEDLLPGLRAAYDRSAASRDRRAPQQFKLDERDAFLDRLQIAGATRLLEIGAGTGHDSAFFRDAGLDVVAVDLSPEMVRHCEDKGIEAYVRDVKNLGFPDASFDAVWTMNCLLHVPNDDLASVFATIRRVLKPGGLMFAGMWGGKSCQFWSEDDARYFVSRSDRELFDYANEVFEVIDFHTVDHEGNHFQALTLVR
jgi:SAM-dependent methyltransferase